MLLSLFAGALGFSRPNNLSRTPPMGFMSWMTFRCGTDCVANPTTCISEALYREQADALVSGGFLAAGYDTIHLDDCIVAKQRNSTTQRLEADPIRFPSGFAALGSYLHDRGVKFGVYTAISSTTCGGYPGSKGFEQLDADTFSEAGADYIKADGCGDPAYYPLGYPALGAALQATGRDIVYSCSWPAYLGDDEAAKPFAAFIASGCNLWRNYLDMGPTGGYAAGVLEHFGNYSRALAEWAGPGHFHDADMLLAGVEGVPEDLMQSQLALYCILALPLIMGNDLRAVSPRARAMLLNRGALAINQDPAGRAGVRLTAGPQQVWLRPLANGDVAVALYNAGPPPAHPWHTPCPAFNATPGGRFVPSEPQPQGWCSPALGQDLLEWYCCNTEDCAGYFFSAATGAGCMLKDVEGGWVPGDANTTSYTKQGFIKPSGAPADVRAGVCVLPRAPTLPGLTPFQPLLPLHPYLRASRLALPLQTWACLRGSLRLCRCWMCSQMQCWESPMQAPLPSLVYPGRALRCCGCLQRPSACTEVKSKGKMQLSNPFFLLLSLPTFAASPLLALYATLLGH